MRVLVTGVSGFVGLHLARHLAEHRDEVLGLGVGPSPPATARHLAGEWHADVGDPSAIESALREASPQAIVHLAARSSGGESFADPVGTYRVNALGTLAVLEATRRAAPDARVLIVGTGDVYGPQPAGSRVDESTPLKPVSPYALSKAAADVAAEYYAVRGLDVIRTRSFGHLGTGQTDRFSVPSLARQIAQAEAGGAEPVVRVGNLEVTRDLSDVRDVVQAYRLLLEHGERGAVYNVCRGEGISLAELARSLIARARIPLRLELDAERLRPADVPYLVGDPGRLQHATSWRATIPLERTLEEILEEWRQRTGEAPTPRV
jgi:GDP-4-dehydro-6-deoxy-D-mannose reductase